MFWRPYGLIFCGVVLVFWAERAGRPWARFGFELVGTALTLLGVADMIAGHIVHRR